MIYKNIAFRADPFLYDLDIVKYISWPKMINGK